MNLLVLNEVLKPAGQATDPELSTSCKEKIKIALEFLEKWLDENDGFLSGGELSIADILGGCIMAQLSISKYDFSDYANI